MRLLNEIPRHARVLLTRCLRSPMQCVEHALLADVPETAVTVACDAIPEDHIITLRFAYLLLDVLIEVEPDNPSQLECLISRETRSPERIPGQHIPLRQSVQVVLAFNGGQLFHAPLLHFAASGFQRVFRTDCVRVELFEQVFLLRLRLRARSTAGKRPRFAEYLEGATETREV